MPSSPVCPDHPHLFHLCSLPHVLVVLSWWPGGVHIDNAITGPFSDATDEVLNVAGQAGKRRTSAALWSVLHWQVWQHSADGCGTCRQSTVHEVPSRSASVSSQRSEPEGYHLYYYRLLTCISAICIKHSWNKCVNLLNNCNILSVKQWWFCRANLTLALQKCWQSSTKWRPLSGEKSVPNQEILDYYVYC